MRGSPSQTRSGDEVNYQAGFAACNVARASLPRIFVKLSALGCHTIFQAVNLYTDDRLNPPP
ncbi:protein of unknown function [Paraburkholderia dioscoreae]|uniref:Uncharacterized protein n=1 Tax=Paraburkholderia dioscoreae TaxID=2604047 RepID=A0A5Q4ZGZ8_9BURK|nr:protein of unknown function [Paraburkholderia dioscoreae]